MSAQSAQSASSRLVFLDLLRGVAALAVVLEHALHQVAPGYADFAFRYFNLGQFGVILFLLISGYVIPWSLERGGSNAKFWVQRLFRLFPIYWCSIGLAFVLYQTTGMQLAEHSPDATIWWINLTMLQEFLRVPHVNGVFWTLTLELMLYAGFSVLYSLGWLGRCKTITGLGVAALLLAGTLLPLVLERRFPAGYALLLVTALLGSAYQRFAAGSLRRLHLVMIGLGLGLTCIVVCHVNFDLLHREGQPLRARAVIASWFIAQGVFLVLFLFRHRNMPESGAYLGRISYSMYLLHGLVLLLVPQSIGTGLYVAGVFSCTILLSTVTFHLIEKPFQGWGKKLTLRRHPSEEALLETRQAA